jgi:hypothetical protein
MNIDLNPDHEGSTIIEETNTSKKKI